MFFLRNKLFKLKNLTDIITSSRHCYISSAALIEARETFKHLGNGCIRLEKDEESGIAVVTLDNLSRKNAISGLMMTQLEEIVDTLENWETGKGVILTSVGDDIFCAGSDLSIIKQQSATMDSTLMSKYMNHILNKLFSLPLITVTLVHNRAVGGGAELTTSTDFRVFTEKGEVNFIEGKMGVTTGFGAGTRLVKIFGPRLALDLLCSGRRLKAEEALKIGYADHIITGQDKLPETKQWLTQWLVFSPLIVQSMKKMIVGARDLNIHDSFINERKIFSQLWGGPLNLEALNKNLKH